MRMSSDVDLDDPWFDRHQPISTPPPPCSADLELDDPWFDVPPSAYQNDPRAGASNVAWPGGAGGLRRGF
jgi:hypothetical protein